MRGETAAAPPDGTASEAHMRDDPENLDGVEKVRDTLARISDVLGIPLAAFYDGDTNPDRCESFRRMREAQMLALVRAYLRDVDREARQRFVEAVQALAEAEAL